MSQDREPFLSRWSRRKLDAKEAAPGPAAASGPPAPAVSPGAVKPELPPVETLRGLASEYKDFLRPEVDEKLRQAALRKLFHDPHFNVMDGLDTYIDDYSKPDPIPDAMMRTLAHAKNLLFDDKKEEAQPAREKPAALSQVEAPRVAQSAAGAAPAVPIEKKDKV